VVADPELTSIAVYDSLRTAVEKMVRESVDVLPVVSSEQKVIGTLDYKDILSAYEPAINDNEKKQPAISLKRRSLKLLVRLNKLQALQSKKK
jgi:predicted transcriptional regulator